MIARSFSSMTRAWAPELPVSTWTIPTSVSTERALPIPPTTWTPGARVPVKEGAVTGLAAAAAVFSNDFESTIWVPSCC